MFLLFAAAVTQRIYAKHYDIWLGSYLFQPTRMNRSSEPLDVIYFVVDHWEPGYLNEARSRGIVDTWMTGYRKLASRHLDSDNRKLQHTFFYPLDGFAGYQADSLVQLCSEGFGDVEVHLHHKDDTSESLEREFLDGIDSLQAHGALISPDGETRFAFAHGNWALDNSRFEKGQNFCGANNEIEILLKLGCYADFTFPSLSQTAQPRWINRIGYATDDPALPKSYDEVLFSRRGVQPAPDELMLFQGPNMIDWFDWRFKTHPTIDDGDLYDEMKPSFHRFELWLKAGIHVPGGPNWVFVRPFTHGARLSAGGPAANLGAEMDEMLTAVERRYRDTPGYRLHYVTAREAYNIARAAEAGMTGNPNDFRDFIVKPYAYRPAASASQ